MIQLPLVQLIGAQKAGTSAIAEWLFEGGGFRRPQVFDDEPCYYRKESHFFDIDWNFHKGINYYARRFEDDGASGAPALDATPDTLAFAHRVHGIYQLAGCVSAVKIIVILRDPIYRELSLYNHLAFACRRLDSLELSGWHQQVKKTDNTIMTFDEFVRTVTLPALVSNELKDRGLGRSSRYGLFANHLREWFELFDRNQILILSYDELQSKPSTLQGRIQVFLGRTVQGNISQANANDSPQKVHMPSNDTKQILHSFFRPHNDRLYQLLEAMPGPPMEQRPFPRFSTRGERE